MTFCGVSVEAKVLYGLLLDRMGLSLKNGWLDEEGRVCIIFTIADIKAMRKLSVITRIRMIIAKNL